MAVTCGYFDSVGGDRTYNAAQMTEYFEGLVSDGVYEDVDDALIVRAAGTNMGITVGSGRAIVDSRWVRNSTSLSLTVTAASASLPRYTAVVIRLDYSARTITITTKDGTPASNPTKPSMTNNGTIKELCLAYIYVAAATTKITQSNIEDMRPSSLCGWVTGLIQQVDTSELFLQWQDAYSRYYTTMTAEFNAWLSALTQQLQCNTYIETYRKSVTEDASTLSSKTISVSLNMSGYTYSNSDVILVWINGIFAVLGTDYTVSSATVTLTANFKYSVATVDIVVLKSKIGISQ